MKHTLLTIPHDWLGWPLLAVWIGITSVLLIVTARTQGWGKAGWHIVPLGLVVSAVIWFVVPYLEISGIDAENPLGPEVPIGLAIRGYGTFLTLAILLAIGMVVIRSKQISLNVDQMVSMCFWMVICGIIGARVFYVVQKWDEFAFSSPQQFLVGLLDMTKGGLVVYGSLIGAVVPVGLMLWRWRLPVRIVLDVVAPALLLGVSIGRLGCLMNGCCYGGVCPADHQFGIRFPAVSPPYLQQLEDGRLLGLTTKSNANDDFGLSVEDVAAQGISERLRLPILPGDNIRILYPDPKYIEAIVQNRIDLDLSIVIEKKGLSERIAIPVTELPARATAVYPAQIFASLNAGLLCGILWFLFPYRRFDGQLFAIMSVLYPISRFFEEMIRDDEQGIFGTSLTISQWFSLGLLAVGIGLYAYFQTRPILTWRVTQGAKNGSNGQRNAVK